jgi:cytochrome c
MFTRKIVVLLLIAAPALAVDSPHLGTPMSPREIAAWDLSIGPDGAGLPPGKGTAGEGAKVYAEKCVSCHGEKGEGKPSDRLVGGFGTLVGPQAAVRTVGSYWPYATTLFDYVRRAMPLTEPQSLTANETYAVAAYILNLNGIIGEKDVINAKTLPKVKMPNRDNFFIVYPGKAP